MEDTYLLFMRCPVYRRHDSHSGFRMELENLDGDDKGKGTSGDPTRLKVPMHRSGAHCLVVARKRGNARGAKGAGHPRQEGVNGQPEELLVLAEAGRLPRGDTSRMNREIHVRICGGLGVQIPGSTRRAPRIHGELLKLGFDLSERSVSRWIQRVPRDLDVVKRWLTFLRNHREAIAAMDFFTVPTLTFGVLYCFFVIGHDRRKILHFNVRRNPNALWIVQQLREAWAYQQPHRFLLFDRDAKFGAEVVSAVREMGSQPTRTAFRSPWQNGIAERWVGSCRGDLLDHVILLNERHLKRLMSLYLRYYHEDRTHLGLGKDTPVGRVAASVSPSGKKIISLPRLGGLHHRYAVAA